MPKVAKELAPVAVSRLSEAGHHAVGGVTGLYLYISEQGGRSWVLRIKVGSKRRHIGLGGYPTVSLAQAKDKARQYRDLVASGIDPIAQKQENIQRLQQEQNHTKSFEECALAYIETKQDEWKNDKHRKQWGSTLRTYAFPVIGQMNVALIGLSEVLSVLEPIWKEKTETASRLRGRIEVILDWATVRNYREGLNPARWKGHLDTVLQAPSKITKVVNHKAVPIEQMPAFIKELKQRDGLAAKALEFLILTAVRSGEVRGACWGEIDFKNHVWVIPEQRMKAGKEHRVPLSEQAVTLLKELPRFVHEHNDSGVGADLIFPAPRGGMLSDMTLTALMRRMEAGAVPHGFRSTFRDWIAESTAYPRDMAEFALAHTLDNKTEAAYLRTDMLEKRRAMMQDWADFVDKQKVQQKVHREPHAVAQANRWN